MAARRTGASSIFNVVKLRPSTWTAFENIPRSCDPNLLCRTPAIFLSTALTVSRWSWLGDLDKFFDELPGQLSWRENKWAPVLGDLDVDLDPGMHRKR